MAKRRKKRKSKKRFKIVLLLIIILAAVLIVRCGHGSSGSDSDETKVVGYLPTWYYDSWEEIDFDSLTCINIAFINPDSEGNLSCGIADENLRKIIKKAHKHDVKVVAALGGGNGYAHYTDLTSSDDSIQAFDDKIMEYIEDHDMDGVDLNIEGDVESSFWNNYDAWVADLEERCISNDMILSCAVASWFDENIQKDTFDRFNYISVMAYDNKNDSENHSTYAYAVKQLAYFNDVRGIDKSKLLLGIPFYGYRYSDGYCTGKTVTYKEVATYNEDSEYVDESGTCRYNGIDTVKKKTELAEDYGGVMVWCLGQDMTGDTSLLKAIHDTLNQ